MVMPRVKFHCLGSTANLLFCAQALIDSGYEQTASYRDADFLLASGDFYGNDTLGGPKPMILLSYGEIYSCMGADGKISNKPFDEADPIVIPSTGGCSNQAWFAYIEADARSRIANHAVLRVFDVYGPFGQSIVNTYTNNSKLGTALPIQMSEHCTISPLFADDFREGFLKFVPAFLGGVRGVYNVGGDQSITMGHLADTVYQTWHNTKDKAPIIIQKPNHFVNFHAVPNITRFKAVTKWTPKTSIRKGVWLTVQGEKKDA